MDEKGISHTVAAAFATYGPKIIGVLFLVFVSWVIAAYARKFVRRGLLKTKFDETLTRFLSNLVRWLILALAGVSVLGVFGVEATSFAALIGAAGIAVGLAFQGTLSSLAAGIMLLIFRPFKVSDVVQVAGVRGTVYEIDLFSTIIDTVDHRRIYVPNSAVFGSIIENISHHKIRRMDVLFSVDPTLDVAALRREVEKRISSLPIIADRPVPVLLLKEVTYKSTDWEMQVWCRSDDAANVRCSCLAFAKEGIDLVLPDHLRSPGYNRGDV